MVMFLVDNLWDRNALLSFQIIVEIKYSRKHRDYCEEPSASSQSCEKSTKPHLASAVENGQTPLILRRERVRGI